MSGKVVYKKLSYDIVGALFEVYNELGYGYQEKYYENAMRQALDCRKINKFANQIPFKVNFKGKEIGKYYLDFLIEDKIILELKKGNYFPKKNIEQVQGYLKATDRKLAILANFTPTGVKFLRVLNNL
jgi:GxxExxY protein